MADEIKPVAEADTKKHWLSKTLWTNAVLAVAALFVPGVAAWISTHPEVAAVVWSVVNSVLRLVTKDKLSLED